MKRVTSSVCAVMTTICFVIVTTLCLTACRKSDYSNTGNSQVSAIMAFNLVTDKPAIAITLSNNGLTPAPLQYSAFTGGYINIYSGASIVQAYDAGNINTYLTNTATTFDPGKYYSLFVLGANNVYSNVIVRDNFDSLSASNGQAYVRYINAIPDSSNPRVTITANGANVIDGNAHYTNVSAFTQVAPGPVTVNLSNEGSIQANRTITVEAQKTYTILLTGTPGNADSTKAVRIRFVENGRLAP